MTTYKDIFDGPCTNTFYTQALVTIPLTFFFQTAFLIFGGISSELAFHFLGVANALLHFQYRPSMLDAIRRSLD